MPGKEDHHINNCSSKPGKPGHRRKNLKQRFEILRSLGQGAYGKVKLAIERDTGQAFAIKTIRKKNITSDQDLSRLRREIEIMANLSHPHIIAIYEVFENDDKIVLIMEYASGGELYDYCNDKRGLYDEEARKFFRQITSAVHYLHMNGIVHRDLKLENIVLDIHGNAKIADFGFANVYGDDKLLSTFCGSPLYASPEIVNGLPYSGPEVDCWSLGVLLYAMVYGAMPFDGTDFRRLRNQITAGDYFKPNRLSDALTVINHMLCPNPKKRATIEDITRAQWVNSGYEYHPTDDTLPGKPVDQEKLVRKLSQGCSSESDCDSVQGPAVSQGPDARPTAAKIENQTTSSQSSQCKDVKVSPPAIKGILKKPRSGSDQNVGGFQRSRSMDLDLTSSVPLRSNHSSQNKKPQRPLSSHVPTHVFDSSKKPKKGILKNSRTNYDSLNDGGGSTSNTTSQEFMPSSPIGFQVSGADSPHKDLVSSEEDSHAEGSATYDLDDIDAVLGSLLLDKPDSCGVDPLLNPGDRTRVPTDEASRDSGIADSSAFESSVFSDTCGSLAVTDKSHTNEQNSLDLSEVFLKETTILTSTPNTQGLTSGRRKRAMKHKGKSTDPTWRYSTGSQGSTSSGDHLDFSYDSADGDSLLSEYFSMPLTHPSPFVDTPNIPSTKPGDCEEQNLSVGVRLLSDGLTKKVHRDNVDDPGPPPPLPLRPPPDQLTSNGDSSSLTQPPTFDLSYNNDDLMEQILWLEKQEAERIAAAEAEKSAKIDWDEVEDIYQQALKLQKEWS